jgi:hypothetical protein
MKFRLKRLGRKFLCFGLAITLLVTITPINLLAQVGPDVNFQLDKSFYQVGEVPTYSITGFREKF